MAEGGEGGGERFFLFLVLLLSFFVFGSKIPKRPIPSLQAFRFLNIVGFMKSSRPSVGIFIAKRPSAGDYLD